MASLDNKTTSGAAAGTTETRSHGITEIGYALLRQDYETTSQRDNETTSRAVAAKSQQPRADS